MLQFNRCEGLALGLVVLLEGVALEHTTQVRCKLTLVKLANNNLLVTLQQLLNAEIVECRAEKDRSHLAREIILDIKFRVYSIDKFKIGTELECKILTDIPVEFITIDIYLDDFSAVASHPRREASKVLIGNNIELAKLLNRVETTTKLTIAKDMHSTHSPDARERHQRRRIGRVNIDNLRRCINSSSNRERIGRRKYYVWL